MKWIVPYVNFREQYKIYGKSYVKAFNRVMINGDFILRDDVTKFEQNLKKYLKTKYVIGVNSGTDGLLLSLGSLGLKKGSEVITVSHTYVATLSAITHIGCKPVFCDIDNDYNINSKKIEALINKNTKAIVAVHLNGRSCNMDIIKKLCKKYKLYLVEDAAQSLGAEYKNQKVGTFGIAGSFSLHPLKSLSGAGDGGFISTNNNKLAKQLFRLRNHGQKSRTDISHFGFNSRLDNLQAALVNIKFKKFNNDIKKRRKIATLYLKNLKNLPIILPIHDGLNNFDTFNSFVIRVKNQKTFFKFLNKKKIEVFINWPKPIHAHKGLNLMLNTKLPITEKFCKEMISLPIFPEMKQKQINYVIKTIKEFFNQ